MKTAYQRAMEKLTEVDPKFGETPLSGDRRERLRELDRFFAAKIAERELSLEGQIARARGEERQRLQRLLFQERERLEAECEAEKDRLLGAERV